MSKTRVTDPKPPPEDQDPPKPAEPPALVNGGRGGAMARAAATGRNNYASCALTDGYRGYRMPLPLTTGAGPCYRDVLRRVWGSPPTRCSLQTRAAGRLQISGRLFPHPRRMRRALSYCCRACITGAAPSQTRADGGSSLRPPPFLTQRKAVLQRNWQGYAGHRLREDRGAPRTRPKTLFEKLG